MSLATKTGPGLIFLPKGSIQGSLPTATDVKTQSSETGRPIPLVYGTVKIAGNIIERTAPRHISLVPTPSWAAGHAYNLDDTVFGPGMSTAYRYICIIPGTSGGTWPADSGARQDIFDGTVHWAAFSLAHYRQATVIGLCEGPIVGLGAVWQDKQVFSNLASIGMGVGSNYQAIGTTALLTGTQPQARPAWSFIFADTYSNTALVLLSTTNGQNNAAPNYAFEVQGQFASIPDGGWAPAWVALTNYNAGQMVQNGGNVYGCTTSGTSAASGGPTGTAADITDGAASPVGTLQAACHWQYISAYSPAANPWLDANPCDIAIDMITHARRGLGESSALIDPVSTGGYASSYRTYCIAAGLDLSWAIDTQASALQLLDALLAATNTDCIWSGGQFKFVPLGNLPITGNGTSYIPPTAVTDIGPDDIREAVQVRRVSSADTFNSWPVEYINRAQGYAKSVVDDPDMSDVDRRGLRRAHTTAHPMVLSPASAIMLSRILAQRSVNVRNEYTVKVNARFLFLEPTDVITISDPLMGLVRQPMRIVEWQEDVDGKTGKSAITLVCEDWPVGVAAAAQYLPQAGDGYRPNASDSVNGLWVDGNQLAPGGVQTAHIADQAVTTGQIGAGAVAVGQQSFVKHYTVSVTDAVGPVDVTIDTQPDTNYFASASDLGAPGPTHHTMPVSVEKHTAYVRVYRQSIDGLASTYSVSMDVQIVRM